MFSDCAQLALGPEPTTLTAEAGYGEVVAHAAVDTILAIYRALDRATPLALLHPRLTAEELLRQRTALRASDLPPGTAFVLFTSGSNGTPRGVVLSREAIVAAATASAACLGWREDDRWLLCLPIAHAGGLSIVVRCLIARKPIILHEGGFDAAAVHALAVNHRASLASLVPTQLTRFYERCPPSLRAVLVGGAAVTPTQIEAAIAAGWPIRPTYGMTETFGQVATATEPGGLPRVLPGVTITAGETLRIRGPMLATRYLDGMPIAPELVTSDLGVVDDDRVYVHGRRDDVIVTGGEKVHPAAVEAVLAATPGVQTACAFSASDPIWGQVVAVAVTVDANFSHRAALAYWYAALAPHARPRRLAVVTGLPTLPSGKLDRCAIASMPTAEVHYDDFSGSPTRT
jgi:O-succinylbenzoic acid--CoA ligase